MKKILIIEDDATIAFLYQKELANAGYQAMIATSGKEGQKIALEEEPALILLDIMMPTTDGFTVIRQLREKSQTSKIPIIVLTNLGTADVFSREAQNLGVKAYLVKDQTSLGDMVAKVRDVFKEEK